MITNTKEIQLQYEGFLNTPLLWQNETILGLHQFELETKKTITYSNLKKPEIRLGKRVEQFSLYTFSQNPTINILLENTQIQHNKRTIGELDCILLKNKQPIHIEIVYKFYLYDKNEGSSEIMHWVGPNKRDSFYQKLNKLKNKQLPLLHNAFTKPYLNTINTENTIQNVFFKAQLFVPLKNLGNFFPLINNKCIYGFYIRVNELHPFKNCKFFIPTKLNWLQEVNTNVSWLSYVDYKTLIINFIKEKSAPLCWVKKPNGIIQKFFLVWWN
jgi:hypothetical protein